MSDRRVNLNLTVDFARILLGCMTISLARLHDDDRQEVVDALTDHLARCVETVALEEQALFTDRLMNSHPEPDDVLGVMIRILQAKIEAAQTF